MGEVLQMRYIEPLQAANNLADNQEKIACELKINGFAKKSLTNSICIAAWLHVRKGQQ